MGGIERVGLEVDAEAVVVTADAPLAVLSSAVAGGGFGSARSIVNLHVDRDCSGADAASRLDRFAERRRLPPPWVGLLTAAWTERAEVAVEEACGVRVLVVATVGLSNPVAAGWSAAAAPALGTINTIVVVDARVEPAALVNLALTVTEVKALVLSTATGHGAAVRFGGPISEAGWVVARAARTALSEGVRRWPERPR